ncbi:MAG: hypothetical protein E7590_04105 [Ruminococcaceae bacterium]|nr:hypothetical protein [Oscillospiraceae bacterium]
MKNALHQLWLDNTEDIFNRDRGCPQVKELTDLIQRNREKLSEALSDAQKETLEKYDDCCAELHDLYFERFFESGFRLGVQLTLAGLL